MNWWMMTAGVLSLLTAAIHVFLGGPEVNAPVQFSEGLALEVRATTAVVWHGITAMLILSGLSKIYAARSGQIGSAVFLVATQYVALAALFIGYGLANFGNLWVLPQWTLFVSILGFVGLGVKYPGRRNGQSAELKTPQSSFDARNHR